MGQKVHPKAFRLGVIKGWSSRWFAGKKKYASVLHRDITLRRAIRERLADGGIGEIQIERSAGNVKVNVQTSKPGVVIGRQGAALEELRTDLSAQFGEKIDINVVEVRKPETDAQLIADNIAGSIERRFPYRRATKQAVQKGIEAGLQGVKVRVAGRLNGADIAREETFKEGNIPLHTIRANVDFGVARANTTYGVIGIKVWTYQGEIFGGEEAKTANDSAKKDWLRQTSRGKKEEVGRLEKELAEKK